MMRHEKAICAGGAADPVFGATRRDAYDFPMTETRRTRHRRRRRPLAPSSYPTSLPSRDSRRSGPSAGRPDADLRLRPHPAARERLLDRHAAAHGERLAARRPRLLLHPHRPDRPLPADARQGGLLPDGLGRQRPAHRAPGAELLRRPLRPVAALRAPTSRRRRSRTPKRQVPISRPNFVELCERAGPAGRAGLRAAVAHARPLGRLEPALHDHRPQGPAGQPARVPAQLRPRRGLPAGGADPLGRHLPDRGRAGRARGPRLRRRLPPRRASTAPDGDAGRTSRPPAPS